MKSLNKLQGDIVSLLREISQDGPTQESQASLDQLKRSLASVLVSALADGHRIFLLKEENLSVPESGLTPFVNVVRNFPDFGTSLSEDLEFFESLLDSLTLEGLLAGTSDEHQKLALGYLQARLKGCVSLYPSVTEFKKHLSFFKGLVLDEEADQELLDKLLRIREEEASPPQQQQQPQPPPPPTSVVAPESPPPSDTVPTVRPMEGKDVLFLCYDKPRNQALVNYFGFSTCDWAHPDDMKGLQAVHDRIKNGYYDVVFVVANRVSHKAQDKAIPKHHNTPVVFTQGFGISAVERALIAQKVLITA